MEQIALNWEPLRRAFTVSELAGELRGILLEHFTDILVSGEISGTKLAASGHYYFTLKDQNAQLRAVCYKMTARYLKFKPQDGIAVLARGRLDLYDARGELQLVVDSLEPQGHGALQFAFEQLKQKLAAEGLFDAARKRPLPPLPERIGVVTSPTGAVIRDMIHILERRSPGRHIRLYPAQVQGEGASEQIACGVEYFSRTGWAEVVIVARGGGSMEDLWAFNEERVARAIAACAVPVISAVGHETDFTIADFVADLRAPTPSAAAELVALSLSGLLERLGAGENKLRQAARLTLALLGRRLASQIMDPTRMHRAMGRRMQRADELDYRLKDCGRSLVERRKRVLDHLTARLSRMDVRLKLAAAWRRLESYESQVRQRMRLELNHAAAALKPLEAHLEQLSPLKILDRGYAIVTKEDGNALVKSPADAPKGSKLRVRVAKGEFGAKAD